jgi:saccharopine dehydrogenase-like NADP-dependent oxidoreductase
VTRILVLGGSGEMGSAAVADLVSRTDHEVSVGDIRTDEAGALLRRLGAPERVVGVDVEDPGSLAAALGQTEVVLNATYMRHNVRVTDAAIAAGVHLVDLGSYHPETLEQLDRHAAAEAAGCRIVPGCGVAPGLTNILARLGADQLDTVRAIRLYSYITHPLWTSPGIVVTRFDASTGVSVVREDGVLVERPSFSAPETFAFPEPYGEQEVHLVPHPEPVTLPRTIDVADVVFKVGYPAHETRRIEALLELGFDRDEPFELDGVPVSPRRFAAAYIGSRGIGPTDRSANVKHVRVEGIRAGAPLTLTYDFAVEETADPPPRRSPGRSPPSPHAVDGPGSIRRRPPSIRARSSRRLPKRGLTVTGRELAGPA